MNKLVKKLMLVAAMLMLAAGPSFAADAIRIGLMCPLTGKWASEGQDMQQIVSLLVSEVNKAGGINGKQIELIVEDDAGDPRTASLAAQKLASAGVMAVIGTYGSAVTEASQNIIDEAEIMQIATGSTSVRLTEKGLPLFFRTCPRDDEQGRVASKVIAAKGYFFISPPSAHDFDTPEAKDFFSRYKAQYNSLPSSVWSVLAGDAFKVIVAALQAGTDANPEAVAKYLKKDLKEYPGLTGKLGFNEKGDRIGDLYKVYEVDGNGGFVLQK